MIDLDTAHRLATGKVTFPVSNYLFNRRRVTRMYRASLESQWYPAEQLREMQLARLQQLVEHAYDFVPYYRERLTHIGMAPADLRELDDVRHLPVLTRTDLADRRIDLVDERLRDSIPIAEQRRIGKPVLFAPFRRHRLVKDTSSGSSGKPVAYYEDGSTSAANWSFEMLVKSWFDVPPGSKEIRVMRLATDYAPANRTARLRSALWRQLVLPGINLSDHEYEITRQELVRYQPEVVWGFVSALTGLAEHIQRGHSLGSYRPRLIIGWAEPVYEHQAALLSDTFGCPVTSLYSAHEVGHMAAQCADGMMHVNQEQVLLDTTGSPGEVHVTALHSYAMPFIRYRLGDVVRLDQSPCPCGRSLQVISELAGRTTDIFYTPDGRMISPNFWFHLLRRDHLAGFVEQFQVTYLKDGAVRLDVVKKPGASTDQASELLAIIRTNLGPETPVELAYVADIPRAPSGKYRLIAWEQ
jgi:phenylacetate-CoA ligase